MKRPAFALLPALFLLLFAACSSVEGDDAGRTPDAASPSTATPTAEPVQGTSMDVTPEPVPGLFWGIPGGPSGPTVAGTRCWGSQCIDMIGAITPPEASTVPPATEMDLQFEAGDPTTVEHGWIPADDLASEPSPMFGGSLVWPGSLPPDNYGSGPVSTPAEPGEYILVVFAIWDGRGDVSFGGYFSVE